MLKEVVLYLIPGEDSVCVNDRLRGSSHELLILIAISRFCCVTFCQSQGQCVNNAELQCLSTVRVNAKSTCRLLSVEVAL